jgi:hypothetical protein
MYNVTSVQNLPFKSYEGRPKPADAPKTHKHPTGLKSTATDMITAKNNRVKVRVTSNIDLRMTTPKMTIT